MPPLTAREVYQQLRDAALEVRLLKHLDELSEPGQVQVDIEGWRLTLDFDGTRLRHCQHCRTPDCLLYTSPSPRDRTRSRMPSSA